MARAADESSEKRAVRVWIDGCYDLFHFGHANALKQAKGLCDCLVAGVHNDQEILNNKGPPVMSSEERFRLVGVIKWVDEIEPNAPYLPTCEMLDRYNCSFCAHGDGEVATLANGSDAYQLLKEAGRYREFERTDDISTTELIQRVLQRQSESAEAAPIPCVGSQRTVQGFDKLLRELSTDSDARSPFTTVYRYSPQDPHFSLLCEGRVPGCDVKVVYISASFDLFRSHRDDIKISVSVRSNKIDPLLFLKRRDSGHLDFFETVTREFVPAYLIVGVYSDSTAAELEGAWPIMSLDERVLSLVPLKYVHCVIADAPGSISAELVERFGIQHVCIPRNSSTNLANATNQQISPAVRSKLNVHMVETGQHSTTAASLLQRIVEKRELFEARNRRKLAKTYAAFKQL